MKQFSVLLALGIALNTAGCEKKASEVAQTVDWYKDHGKERTEMLARCNTNPGELGATPNCVNASRAASATTWGAKSGGFDSIKPLTADEINKK